MTQTAPNPVPNGDPDRPAALAVPPARRVGQDLAVAAAARLVSQQLDNTEAAARRFIATAPAHGIDLSLMFATPADDGRPGSIGQVALIVPGHGRTGMFFLSEPTPGLPEHTRAAGARAQSHRVACIHAALDHVRTFLPQRVKLAQALPGPSDAWAINAYAASGFVHAGTLAYMRGPLRALRAEPGPVVWPAGVRITPCSQLLAGSSAPADRAAADRHLITALERSYAQTLDCPELCGLRDTADILASHRATGQYDPRLWFILWSGDQPEGCMLLSRCPDQRCVELVYLGLSPAVRGKGLGRLMLRVGVRAMAGLPEEHLACAVDRRNTPALKLYESLGLAAFSDRVAMVRNP